MSITVLDDNCGSGRMHGSYLRTLRFNGIEVNNKKQNQADSMAGNEHSTHFAHIYSSPQ